MTKPPSSEPGREGKSQVGPEVKLEVIKDLDATGDDVKDIVGGSQGGTHLL